MDQKGDVLLHRNMLNDSEFFLKFIIPETVIWNKVKTKTMK